MIEIPLTTDPEQRFTINLFGTLYRFVVIYNTRYESWSFDLSTPDEEILTGVMIVGGIDLLDAHALDIRGLYAIDLTDLSQDATSETLGESVKLVLFTEGELESVQTV